MTRVCVIVTCLMLGTAGTSFANPPGYPGTVSGSICGLSAHMAGSSTVRQEKHRTTQRPPLDITMHQAPDEKIAYKRLAKSIKQSVVTAATTPDKNQAEPLVSAAPKQEPAPQIAAVAAAPPKVEPLVEPEVRVVAAPVKVELHVRVAERTPQEQVTAAMQIAAQITATETAGAKAGSDETPDASTSPERDASDLVALVISRADMKSVSALSGANIAIDTAQSGAENDIRTSLAAAGATEVQLTPGDAKPVDRVIWGEVAAAVVGLVSSDAAEAFPEVKGFKVLRVPLVHQDRS